MNTNKHAALFVAAGMAALLGYAALAQGGEPVVPYGKDVFSKPITSIWFRRLREHHCDFVFIRHHESSQTWLLPAWPDYRDSDAKRLLLKVSNRNIYEYSPAYAQITGKKENKLIRPADQDRTIAKVSWSTIHNSDTGGPTLDLAPALECRVRQYPFRYRMKDGVDVPMMHMRCVEKSATAVGDAPRVEHNFDICLLSAEKRKLLSGEVTYEGDIEKHPHGYQIVKQSHEFCLQDQPKSQL